MRLTKQDKLNLTRFGSTLQAHQKLFCVQWCGADRKKALTANILARVIFVRPPAGPLLCLALEISPTRALARYCYFPFNLKVLFHRQFLQSIVQSGQMRICFLSSRRDIVRNYQLTASQHQIIKDTYAEVLSALKDSGTAHKYQDAVTEFENTARISQFFERAVSDNEFDNMFALLETEALKVPPEKLALARQIVHGLADVVIERHRESIRKGIESLPTQRAAFLILLDIRRECGSNYTRFLEFVANGIAVNTDEATLTRAADWPSKLRSLIKLFDAMALAPQAEQTRILNELTTEFSRILDYLQKGRGLSFSTLSNALLPLRPLLPGQSGRPPKDYSKEYEWKATGLSWTNVTKKSLKDNPETREEFQGRDFDALAFEEQANLKHRIREGVRSYADRTGKAFPVPKLISPQTT